MEPIHVQILPLENLMAQPNYRQEKRQKELAKKKKKEEKLQRKAAGKHSELDGEEPSANPEQPQQPGEDLSGE